MACHPGRPPAVTFDFTARVTSIDTVIFPGVSIGDIVAGSYSFNLATPDNFPANSQFGIYRDTSGTFDLILEGELLSLTRRVPYPSSLVLALLALPALFWWTRRARHPRSC